jgi:quercetin dioxygenase-like cupin family protein
MSDPASVPIGDLDAGSGSGPLWGIASEDLNATLLAWRAGEEVPEHVNDERDVLLVVTQGAGTLWIDGAPVALAPHQAVLIPKGTSRRICAGDAGLRYVSVHLRRHGLTIGDLRPTS